MHEEDLDHFVKEQKAKLAAERRVLGENPTSAVSDYLKEKRENLSEEKIRNHFKSDQATSKAFVVDSSDMNIGGRPETPKIFRLGEDYKQFRNQLNEQRHNEYLQRLNKRSSNNLPIKASNDDQHERPEFVKQSSDLGLSLPIRDHLSAQERLRRERNREYNEMLKRRNETNNKLKYKQQKAHTKTEATKVYLPQTDEDMKEKTNLVVAQLPKPLEEVKRSHDDWKQKVAKEYEAAMTIRREADKYANEIRRQQVEQLNDELQKRREADEYANARRREADEYADAKRRDAESYQHLLERKRREEQLYRKEEDYLRDSIEYIPVRRRPPRRRPRVYYDEDLDDFETLDDDLYRRLRSRKPRLLRHIIDDDLSSESTPSRKISSRDAPRSDQRRKMNSAGSKDHKSRSKELNSRSRSAPLEQEFTGLPIGERDSFISSNQKKERYRLELEEQMREKEQRRLSDRFRDRSGERSDQDTLKSKKVTYADEVVHRRRRTGSEGDSIPRRFPKPIITHPQSTSYRATAPPVADLVTPYDQAYYFYGAQNPLDPSFATPAPLSGLQSSSFPPPAPPIIQRPAVDRNIESNPRSNLVIKSLNGTTGLFPSDDVTADERKQKSMNYQEELRHQMELKRREKDMKKREKERYEEKKDAEARAYNPWGKGGGGAPMRDLQGNLISDLRRMRQTNDEFNLDPSKYQQVVQDAKLQQETFSPRHHDNTITPRFGRSNPFENKETALQKTQKDLYKEELQRQIDERRRIEAERRAKLKAEEELEEKRLLEQNQKMKEEFEAEKRKKEEKLEEQKRKNEELQRALEDQRRDEERKRREQQSNRDEETRRQKEKELDRKLKMMTPRQSRTFASSRKPVIAEGEKIPRTPVGTTPRQPAVAARKRLDTHRKSHKTTARTPRPVSPRENTPRYLQSRESSRISRELSALRRQLMEEQRRIEDQLGRGGDDVPKMSNQQLINLSKLKQRPTQVVRRPKPLAPGPQTDQADQMALKEFNEFKYQNNETSDLRLFKSEFPEQPFDSNALEQQQAQLIRTQIQNLASIKNEKSHLTPPQRLPIHQNLDNHPSVPRTTSPNSLLEAETTYIPISEELPPTPNKKLARQRRREDREKENVGQPEAVPSFESLTISDVERLAGKNQRRLTKLDILQGDEISLNDPDDILDRFVNQQRQADNSSVKNLSLSKDSKRRSGSVTTVDTEPWLRPGSTN